MMKERKSLLDRVCFSLLVLENHRNIFHLNKTFEECLIRQEDLLESDRGRTGIFTGVCLFLG
jgi:hypothetical protein